MSDLTATNCGCNNGTSNASSNGCSSLIWIIILLSLCGGCGGNGLSLANNNDNGCETLIILLLLLSCCGGNNNGCGF